jgi:methionine synthase / methylenetetrahydrofolate reductase(NADPH)
MSRFLELLADDRSHVFDGAMGTMLYQRGVFINRSFDELNLTEPDLVRGVHRAYVQAGAELLETNSFGANRVKLAHYGLEERVRELNERAARLAREAAGERVLVGGAVGPLGIRIEPYGPTALEEARGYFREQIEGLLEGGIDFLILETFADPAEIQQAILAAREACSLPVLAQMTVQEGGTTVFGTTPVLLAARLDAWGADAIGLNCSVGPAGILEALEAMAGATRLKLAAQPNAGLPRDVGGRQIYMASPEYMAKYTQRLIRAGAKLVGGCCGTTPEHIRRIVDAARALSPGRTRVHGGFPAGAGAAGPPAGPGAAPPAAAATAATAPSPISPASPAAQAVPPATPDGVKPVPLAERSRWGAKLAAGELVTTVEIVPPRGVDPQKMLEGVRLLKAAGVDAVNVPDGPRAQMRMGALPTAVLIEREVGQEAVVHYACRDRNLLGMLSDLLGAHALGLRNLLLVTGDPPKMGPYPEATAVFDIDAIGLTNLVSRLNHGLDPGNNPIGTPTAYTIGVGLNPVAADRAFEVNRFYWKVDAGAEYAITQPVFDPDQLLEMIEELKQRQIWIPIVAGIWPLVSVRNAEFLANEVPGVVVAPHIVERMRRASEQGKEHALEEGIAIARETVERILPHVQGVQVSAPFGKVPFALRVLEGLLQGVGVSPTATAAAGGVDDIPVTARAGG